MRQKCYCAFIRGINVNGKNMKMAEVCEIFRSIGMTEVSSVLATGNIIFCSKLSKEEVRIKLEKAISLHFAYQVHLFIKEREEINQILMNVPFTVDPKLHVYTFICEEEFDEVLLDAYNKILPAEKEQALVNNNIFYWQVKKGFTLESGFSKILAKKDFKDKFTSRNINTILKVKEKMRNVVCI